MAVGEHTPDGETLHKRLMEKFGQADRLHAVYRQRWEHFYALYRGFTDWQQSIASGKPRDVYNGLEEARREWGAELFIPRTFATVETIVPRMVGNRPRMLALPRRKTTRPENAKNMQFVVDAQQSQIDYELKLSKSIKVGLILGLAVQKVAWQKLSREKRSLKKPTVEMKDGPAWVEGDPEKVAVFDDPNVWHVDPFDWLWDPYASSMDDMRFCFHRTWRDTSYCWRKIESGDWTPLVREKLTGEDVQASSPSSRYEELHASRLKSASLGRYSQEPDSSQSGMHEVLEFHDGDNVVTILDRQTVVNKAANPSWHGQIPFVIFRPMDAATEQLPGIGVVEPMEHLQLELNTLRSQRRDNATIKLNAPLVYGVGKIAPEDLVFGPGKAIPAHGDVNEALKQLIIGDIPNSSYQEDQGLVGDMEVVSGVSDPVTGAGVGDADTATGVQLVQAAANERIKGMVARAMDELVIPATRLFGELNQQHIIENRDVRLPSPPVPGEPDRRWTWEKVSPEGLQGEYDWEPKGGAISPENTVQDRSDAQAWVQLLASPIGEFIDREKIALRVVELMGADHPESLVRPPTQPLPEQLPQAFEQVLAELGMDPAQAQQVVQHALELAVQAEQEQDEQPEPGQNGNAPAVEQPAAGPVQ